MRNGRIGIVISIFFLVLSFVVRIHAQTVPGSSPKHPVTFIHLDEYLRDARPSVELFEQVVVNDMLAVRLDTKLMSKPVYMMMDNGYVSQVGVAKVSFQGMFWGPLFTFGVWAVPCFVGDMIMAVAGGDSSAPLTQLNTKMLELSMAAYEKQGSEEVPVSGLFRINVLFASDLMVLDFRGMGGTVFTKTALSLLGRTYAGLTFKILDSNYFFAGFNFLHYPYIYGWQDYVASDPGFSQVGGLPRYTTYMSDEDSSFSSENLLYETRTKIFLYNNFLNLFQIRALLNIDAQELLDLVGAGFILDLWNRFELNSYLSYLNLLKKYSLDLMGEFKIWKGLGVIYKYNLALKPFEPLDYLKLGVDYYYMLDDEDGGYYVQATAFFVTFLQDKERKWGCNISAGVTLPLSTRLIIGASYNADETMMKLGFASDQWIYSFSFEIGMDNNFDYRMQAKEVNHYVEE